jgi:hypothetical protein
MNGAGPPTLARARARSAVREHLVERGTRAPGPVEFMCIVAIRFSGRLIIRGQGIRSGLTLAPTARTLTSRRTGCDWWVLDGACTVRWCQRYLCPRRSEWRCNASRVLGSGLSGGGLCRGWRRCGKGDRRARVAGRVGAKRRRRCLYRLWRNARADFTCAVMAERVWQPGRWLRHPHVPGQWGHCWLVTRLGEQWVWDRWLCAAWSPDDQPTEVVVGDPKARIDQFR